MYISVFILVTQVVLYIWLVVDFVAATLCHLYKLEQWPTLCTQTQVFNKFRLSMVGTSHHLGFNKYLLVLLFKISGFYKNWFALLQKGSHQINPDGCDLVKAFSFQRKLHNGITGSIPCSYVESSCPAKLHWSALFKQNIACKIHFGKVGSLELCIEGI